MTGHEQHEVAQRPRRLRGLRLVPLTLLMLAVVAAGVTGRLIVEPKPAAPVAEDRGSQAVAKASKTSLPRSCTLPVRQGLRGREPWLDPKLRPQSEKKFTRRLAKEEPAYVRGEDGWLFWNDWQINDMSQSVGRVAFDEATVERWARYISRMKRQAEASGGKFYVMVAPAKWDVYPHLLPRWARDLRGSVSLDLLMRAQPRLPFIDVRSALRTASRKNHTYEPLDSHWTPYGGYVAWKAATRCLRAVPQGDKALGVPRITGIEKVAANNEFAAQGVVPPAQPVRTVPVYKDPLPTVKARSLTTGAPLALSAENVLDATLMPAATRTRGAQTGDRLLVLRDSTGGALSPLWEASFRSTIQVSHGLGGTGDVPKVKKLVKKYRPDITMLVLTERYFGYDPFASS